MKRVFRTILSLAIVFIFLISAVLPSLSVSAKDSQDCEKMVFSEYDYIVGIRKMNDSEQKKLDIPDDKKEKILSNGVENEILARKELSDKVLSEYYNYTEDEIAILRKYDGGRLEDHPELRAITGKLTFQTPYLQQCYSNKNKNSSGYTSKVRITFSWEWDHCPLICCKDVVGICWDATFGNENGNMRVNRSQSTHVVYYADYPGYQLGWYPKYLSVTQVQANHAVKSEFKMCNDAEDGDWAKHGDFILQLDSVEGSGRLTAVDFVVGYGHTVLGFTPGISFDYGGPGIGISFGPSTSETILSGYVSIAKGKWINN